MPLLVNVLWSMELVVSVAVRICNCFVWLLALVQKCVVTSVVRGSVDVEVYVCSGSGVL